MAKAVRIELDHQGMDELLKRDSVESLTKRVAVGIANDAEASQPQHESGPVEYFPHSKVGRTRALAWVASRHPMGAYLEHKYRTLAAALLRAKL